MPSARNWFSGSELMFVSGNTATTGGRFAIWPVVITSFRDRSSDGTNSAIVANRSSGAVDIARCSASSCSCPTSGRAARTLGARSVKRRRKLSSSDGAWNGVVPVSIS